MKISVIVPIFNVSKYLSRCLKSIIAQTYPNLEIILIDDGSTDNSLEIAQDFKAIDNRIILKSKPNGGVSSARNLGLDLASGDYIAFVDPDDYLDARMYEIMVKEIEDADILVCNHEITNKFELVDLNHFNYQKRVLHNDECVNYLFYPQLGNGINAVVIWNKLYKQELFLTLRFNENFLRAQDEELIFKLLLNSSKVVLINQVLYYYYSRPDNNIRLKKTLQQQNDSFIQIINMYEDRLAYALEKKKIVNKLYAVFYNLLIEYYFLTQDNSLKEYFYTLFIKYRSNKNMAAYQGEQLNLKSRIRYKLFSFSPNLYKLIVK